VGIAKKHGDIVKNQDMWYIFDDKNLH